MRVSGRDGVVTIVLDRPHKRNALSRDMQVELCRLLAEADQDGAVRAVILTGADPAFCAGNDFTDAAQFADRYGKRFWHHPARALWAMGKPVICAVNGACVGGGLEIALSASFVVASERATFADTHARLDVVPTWGLTALLPQAVGVRRAREMSLTGRSVSAAEAERIGLVNHVVPHERLLPFAGELAGQVPRTGAVRDVLRLYDRGPGAAAAAASEWEQAVALERPFDPAGFAAAGRDEARRRAGGESE
ncbi:enoyl-CoA hydratase-related protein [Phytohabitans houttuyneae]|uniref:Enoyl-CoA hydratase n=1 Tax=Phytohabitans houttuyneae TaxID=1076126 RepID=A0A6V8KIU7_9ACTN|nr:enoyl-CoA hydratase-related protein [Phytohabitans houttuyneae]GFJ82358.1 enoyl-CoA hydratase [Phytohabitans houttuyneae]